MKYFIHLAILFTTTALLLSATAAAGEKPRPGQRATLQAWLSANAACQTTAPAPDGATRLAPLARFYENIGYRMVWMRGDGLSRQGESLLNILENAAANGLSQEDYALPAPVGFHNATLALAGGNEPAGLAPHMQMDIVLTGILLRYASHVSRGRIPPSTLNGTWDTDHPERKRNLAAGLAAAVDADSLVSYLDALAPPHPAYGRLKAALRRYEQIRVRGGWGRLDAGPSLRRGDQDPRIPILRHRLALTDDLMAPAPGSGNGYDGPLEVAVMRFQHRHGLVPEGVVGRKSLGALNVLVEDRIRMLRLNMERWRWHADTFGPRYLWVNIPDFTLAVMEDDWAVGRMRAIVGRTVRQKPSLSGRVIYLEFNPYWNVPHRIARRDILPKIMQDPAYLTRQGFKVFDSWQQGAAALDPGSIAWDRVSNNHFPYRLRQEPSASNALGQVKFMFPNRQSIYIHDTPAKSLFEQNRRSFSSGCVRVESPLILARYLLRDQRWDRVRIENTIHSGKRKTVVLKAPIPVHLVYFTAWIDESGQTHFRKDVYGRDQRLQLALSRRAAPTWFCKKGGTTGNLLARRGPDRH